MAQGAAQAVNVAASEDSGRRSDGVRIGGKAGSEGGYIQCSGDRMFDSHPHSAPYVTEGR